MATSISQLKQRELIAADRDLMLRAPNEHAKKWLNIWCSMFMKRGLQEELAREHALTAYEYFVLQWKISPLQVKQLYIWEKSSRRVMKTRGYEELNSVAEQVGANDGRIELLITLMSLPKQEAVKSAIHNKLEGIELSGSERRLLDEVKELLS